jgi:hypothetical protein
MRSHILLASCLLLAAPLAASAAVLSLADVNPGSNAFYVHTTTAGSTGAFTNASNQLTLSFGSTTNNAGGLIYNTIYFTPQTLGANQSITVSFSGTLNNYFSSDNSFRVGLFNSNTSQLGGNVTTNAGTSALNGYTGYSAYYRATGTAGAAARGIYERTGANDNLWQTGTANVAFGDGTTNPQKTLGLSGANAAISGTFTITNNGASTSVSSTINGVSYTFTDTASPYVTFDTLSFLIARQNTGTATTSLTLDSLSVTVIPEPSAFGALAGLFALGSAALRRRSRR